MAADVDIETLGLLDGLEGAARRQRAELIEWLLDQGFTVEQIRGAVATPLLLPANQRLRDDGVYVSARRVCEATGIELELLQRLQRAVGLPRIDDPDAPVLLRADAEAVVRAKIFIDMGADSDETVAVMRTLMDGLSRAAAVMRDTVIKAILRPGATELQLAQAAEAMALRSAPQIGPMLEDLLLLALRNSFEKEAVDAAEMLAGKLPGARKITVAFADLAGFTRLGEELPPEELERVANRLASLAHDLAVTPVQFVKSIGDAVMLVSFEAAPLLEAILNLVDAAAANGLPRLRIGVAHGSAVTRAGDWFGSPVNVASRVTGAARPGTVMAAESARAAVGDAPGVYWLSVGAHRFKGVKDEVKLFRIQRAAERVPPENESE
jgi:adenylate cyclase